MTGNFEKILQRPVKCGCHQMEGETQAERGRGPSNRPNPELRPEQEGGAPVQIEDFHPTKEEARPQSPQGQCGRGVAEVGGALVVAGSVG